MEQDEQNLDLEEGEIDEDNDEVQLYTPLVRPQTYALDIPQKRFPEVSTQYSDSEEELQSSDSDSDSDTGLQRSKKAKKVKPTPKPLQRHNKIKKYDIWSTRAQEDVLAETMNSCDVTIKDRSRDVETYDYSLARKYYNELEERQSNKRTRDDRKNVNFSFRSRKKSNSQEKDIKGKPRIIPDLTVDATCDIEDIAKEVANKLCEEREDLILKVLDAMGKEKTIDIFNETKRIEADGGMLIMNQTRRRTPGGVFLFLVRHDYHITPEQKQKIFDEEKQKHNKIVKEMKKKKLQKMKKNTEEARSKLLPDLITRAELLAKQNPTRKLIETDERNCINPPPSPETDAHESGDGMDPSPTMESQPLISEQPILNHTLKNPIESSRGKLKTYDDDFLDIGCDNDMDFF